MALSDALTPFVWGAGGARKTPEQIARDREVAAALMKTGVDFSPIASPWQGLARVANAAAGAYGDYRANQAEAANAAENKGLMSQIAASLMPQQFPAAPSLPSGDVSAGEAPSIPQTAEASAIRDGLISRGLAPHIADAFVLNFQDESGLNPGINERNPIVPGSRGGFGLYQLTGPRRRAYEQFAAQRGVDPSDVDAQLDFLMTEMQGPEAKAAQSILSAPDTGTAAAAIVNDFLRPSPEYRNSRANRYLALAGQAPAVAAIDNMAAGQPTQVASLDPSIGMAQEAQAAPALPAPRAIEDRPVAQVAQALTDPDLSRVPVTAGGNAGVYQPGQGNMQAIVQALSSPYADDQTKKIAGLLLGQRLEQQQQAADPLRQLQIRKAQQELDQGKLINAGNGFLYNPTTQEWITSPGANAPKETDDIREYNFARGQGYSGTFQDFQTEMKRAGATNVNVGAGEKAWDQESAKLFAKRYDDITGAAGNAQTMLGMYDLAEQALTSGVRTGFGAETELNLRQLGASMGIDTDPEKLAGGELIRSIQNRMALLMRSPDGGMGMPGALSDRDIKFLKDAQIGLDRSPQGNRRMLEAYRAMEQRKIDIAQLADQYVQENGRLDAGFNKAVRDYAAANPLFPETPDGTTPQPGSIVDGYRYKGGDPADPNSWEPVQ